MSYGFRDWGAKHGGGGMASGADSNRHRRERLRQIALDTADLSKDPYFMKNHLGSYECKLCLTLHSNEGSYLAHTQGKRHQTNLARRNAMLAAQGDPSAMMAHNVQKPKKIAPRKSIKIGRPGYKVVRQLDPNTGQRGLLFQLHYPKVEKNTQPRHRFMSAFEQRVERPDGGYQYILFAAQPYETVGFKIPNMRIDKTEGKFFTHWDPAKCQFTLQLLFENTTDREFQEPANG